MDQPDLAAAGESAQSDRVACGVRDDARKAARREVLAAHHRERSDQDLDAVGAEVVGERALVWQHHQRLVRGPHTRRDQAQLTVGAVAAARGVQQQYARQSSTGSTAPGMSGTRPGWMIEASNSRPSMIRGPGREKYAAASTA